jgi:transcriptional regulator with XRE-family HTH domain
MDSPGDSLTDLLRSARNATRLSQHALSLRMGVSQRHVSFVESGRARPSRELLAAWLQELNAPLVVRNAAMLRAGFAPMYSAASLGDSALAQANDAIAQLLQSHDPMPALVLDAHWNLVRTNAGGRWLAETLMPWTANLPDGTPVNMLDLLAHPMGFCRRIVNLREVAPAMLAHLHHEAAALPALAPNVSAVVEMVHSRIGPTPKPSAMPRPSAPMLTTRFATEFGELAFFSMYTTFGTPHDITLASLRIEHMFAADDVTRAVLRAQVPI